jgi:virginiamycin B lyase
MFPLSSIFTICIITLSTLEAATIKVTNEQGVPLGNVMVTQSVVDSMPADTSDNGYQQPMIPRLTLPNLTKFTDTKGLVSFPSIEKVKFRFRKFKYIDQEMTQTHLDKKIVVKLIHEKDLFKQAEQKPANVWLGALEIGNKEDKIIFKMQCGFCHQQGNAFTRMERSEEEWKEVISRMIGYGSRLPSDLQDKLPKVLETNYKKLRDHPALLAEPAAWNEHLSQTTITEWPIGDSMSQTHDMLISKNKLVYVCDNIQDRLYEINTDTNMVSVYKIPHHPGEENGGLIAGRLKEFPRHESTSNAHSLAESQIDGHIFITPSAQRRLVEFDPQRKKFILHEMDDGFYPHTIRIDQKDNVWFTMALSNQVAKFDRTTKKFTLYDLPARNFKEKIITKNIGFIFKLINWGIPLNKWLSIDRVSTGAPLLYGIDITPDGMVWFARLHTKEIGRLNPADGKITMTPTPFWGPRRLRADSEGNLWIVSFGESLLARYNPKTSKFSMFDLPVAPKGSETPYALNVDKKRNIIWVNGNQSDGIYGFDAKTEKWNFIPFPRLTTFTRDVEIDEEGTLYTANSNFPSWHIEGEQPTLIQISP